MIYFTEHQKETFLLWKNLRKLRKGKGLISDKDATEVSDFQDHVLEISLERNSVKLVSVCFFIVVCLFLGLRAIILQDAIQKAFWRGL